MFLLEKYRVHEVAKDFGLPTKTITEILTKYVAAPKNHMQVLTDHELSVIFDYLTQHNQVAGIQAIFADVAPEKKEAPKAAPAQQQNRGAQQHQQNRPAQQQNRGAQQGQQNRPAQQQNRGPQQGQQNRPAQQQA